MGWAWIKQSPMRDGSGVIRHAETGRTVKVIVHDLVTTTHRVALEDGREVARASKFTTLLKRLDAQKPES